MIQPITSLRWSCVQAGDSAKLRTMIERHDTVADIEDVVHPVGDQDDADAVILEALDKVENLADFLDRQRRRRLVHDHDPGIEGGGAGDGDRLALAAREFLDRSGRRS